MQSGTRTRREVAETLGLTYSTLRVYERHLGDLLELSQGPNRTTLYTEDAVQLMEEAIARKQSGLPFSKLRDYFRGRLAPPSAADAVDTATLERIRHSTEEMLSIGQRIEEKLQRMEERLRRESRDLIESWAREGNRSSGGGRE